MTRRGSRRAKKGAKVRATAQQIDAAIARNRSARTSQVVKASYRFPGDQIVLVMSSGVEVSIPRALLQGLETAPVEDLRQIEIEGPGTGLHWPSLGVDHYIPALLTGVFGTRHWMSELGRKGGSVRSRAKAAAARLNGRRGGRPRKPAARKARLRSV